MRGILEKFGVLRKFVLKYREHFRENLMIFAKMKSFLPISRNLAFSFQLKKILPFILDLWKKYT